MFSKYDWNETYEWNYRHAPRLEETSGLSGLSLPGKFQFCGLRANSPLGMPAGPLLNGRWLLHYSRLGFDVLTYKTVRSEYRECYAMPNLQPIHEHLVQNGQQVHATKGMDAAWAISFGMPSMAPDVWRADVEWTRSQLESDKVLVVSVVATPESDWSIDQVAGDYARCARWAVDSGADAIELNFSCPNVASLDGQLYQNPDSAQVVMQSVRQVIGTTPLVIKIGYLMDVASIDRLLSVSAGLVQGIAMTNCLACRVKGPEGWLFDGQARGIGGEAIRVSSLAQVQRFATSIQRLGLPISLIGVGGVSTAEHVLEYLDSGAESVQIATAAMLQPDLALKIRKQLEPSLPSSLKTSKPG